MKITFLGTGAADFSPLLQTEYKDRLDLNARRSSAVLLDACVLIDCGPHVLDAMRILHLDARRVTDLLVTHFHGDHFDPHTVSKLAANREKPLRIWYSEKAPAPQMDHVHLCPLKIGEKALVGGMEVIPLAANHTAWPVHYDISVQDKRLFYGCDGAWLLNDTFYAMMQRKYQVMILDGTVGDYQGDYRLGEHNSIPMLRLMAASFKSQQVLAEDGVMIVSHIARTLHLPHAETAALLQKDGFMTAFDGMEWHMH